MKINNSIFKLIAGISITGAFIFGAAKNELKNEEKIRQIKMEQMDQAVRDYAKYAHSKFEADLALKDSIKNELKDSVKLDTIAKKVGKTFKKIK